jgi:hypothetical protein
MKARKQETPKAGEWILDSSRRLFITGARKTEQFVRFNGKTFKASAGTILVLVSLRVRNAVPNKTMRIGIHGKVISAEGTSMGNLFCDLPVDSAASLTAVLPSGAESKATLVFRVPKDFTPEKLQIELSNLGQLLGDKKTHDVSLTNCDLTATTEQFDVKTAPKPAMPTTQSGATQQNGDAQGTAGAWVSDGFRRVFVTGIRRMDVYKRGDGGTDFKILNPNQKLYAMTVVVENTVKGAPGRVGLGYIASNLAGVEGDAIGDPQFDIVQGSRGGLTKPLATGERATATLVWRGSASFRPKAVMLHLSHLGSMKSNPRIVRISLENCDLDATAPQFTPK